ncbi:hypothetical protein GW916_13590 [bacterium]|nr:hypothetical protein [bacterium]
MNFILSFLSNFAANVIYYSIFAFGILLRILPFPLKKFVTGVVATLWFYLFPFRKRVILHNLALVFPRRSEESNKHFQSRCEAISRRNIQHYLLMLLEVFERLTWSNETARAQAVWDHHERMQALVDQGTGFFFLSLHLGNWETLTRVGCAEGLPLTIITRYLRNPVMDRVWVKSRKQFGLELLAESGSGLAAIKSVKRGRALGFISDQHTGEPHGIEATFLGHPAWCPKALAMMADRLKAPVLPIALIRDMDTGTCRIFVEEVMSFPRIDPKHSEFDASLRSGSGALNHKGLQYFIEETNKPLEAWIRRFPEQYLWIHKRFKNFLDYSKEPLPWEL